MFAAVQGGRLTNRQVTQLIPERVDIYSDGSSSSSFAILSFNLPAPESQYGSQAYMIQRTLPVAVHAF